MGQTAQLLSLLAAMVGSQQDAKVRQFAMYVFEVLSEINVNTEELQS